MNGHIKTVCSEAKKMHGATLAAKVLWITGNSTNPKFKKVGSNHKCKTFTVSILKQSLKNYKHIKKNDIGHERAKTIKIQK